MKKWMCLLVALSMVLGSAACGGAPDAPATTRAQTQETTAAAPAEAATEAAEDKIQLTLGIYPESTNEAMIAAYDVYMANYAKRRPDVNVIPAHYFYALETIVPLAESGSLPVIFEPWYTEPQKLIRAGYVRPVTELLKERGWDEQINPSIRDLLSADGEIYGVPRDAYALGLQINMELFEEAGLVEDGVPLYPKTWDELAETGKQIKEATGSAGLCLLAMDNAGGWHWTNIAWAFGAHPLSIDNGDGTFTANLNTPEAIEAMEYISALKWEHDILTADPLTENWGTGFTQLGVSNAAMYIGANDAVDQPTVVNGLPLEDFALVPLPAGPGGQYSLNGGTVYMFAANATDEQVDAALDFMISIGRAPEIGPELIEGLTEDARGRKENGAPVLRRFPAWVGSAYANTEAAAISPFLNVDMRLYQDYFDKVAEPGNLRLEEQGLTQEMYAEITKVLQAVLSDENADIPALLEAANHNYQIMLNDAGIGK
ncbi:MAG: extracellular solute-binding protein [Clostridiales bacterium]|jgi:ABC-type glycerol-3-phosphate transport system substrate-binding protein|nr:extracellular solute-binding protein [Clostridiales bacterium]